jgi:hypothetical protein
LALFGIGSAENRPQGDPNVKDEYSNDRSQAQRKPGDCGTKFRNYSDQCVEHALAP